MPHLNQKIAFAFKNVRFYLRSILFAVVASDDFAYKGCPQKLKRSCELEISCGVNACFNLLKFGTVVQTCLIRQTCALNFETNIHLLGRANELPSQVHSVATPKLEFASNMAAAVEIACYIMRAALLASAILTAFYHSSVRRARYR